MDRFIARENIKHFQDHLWSENDPEVRSRWQKILVVEEDKLGKDLELLTDIERHITDGNQRIERQRSLVAAMTHDGHGSLTMAQSLLDGMIETQSLYMRYRERVLIEIRQRRR